MQAKVDSWEELTPYITSDTGAILFNYPIQLRGWLQENTARLDIKCPKVLIQHDFSTQEDADSRGLGGFFTDFVYFNPGLVPRQSFVHKIGRIISRVELAQRTISTEFPRIGTFGFATGVKKPEWFCKEIRENFGDRAKVSVHMPPNDVVDPNGDSSKQMINYIIGSLPGIEVTTSTVYKSKEDMVRWLSDNDLNVFFFGPEQKGLSSSIDLAIAAGRPIAANKVDAFAHLHGRIPSPFVEDYPENQGLRRILSNGDTFSDLRDKWSPENFLAQWEYILDKIVS